MTEPREYVVVHTRRIDVDGAYDDVLLVLKDRPAWQKGRLNLIGGKVEEGEDPITAAVRELKEEAGLVPLENQPPLYCGKIWGPVCPHKGGQFIIHCIRLDVDTYDSQFLKPRDGETEVVEWFGFKDAWADERLMPNLQVTVPLMHLGVTGWNITDQCSVSGVHDVVLQLPLKKSFDIEYRERKNG